MNFNEYQRAARETAVYPNIGNNLWYPALGLGESGEVQNVVKKVYRDHKGVFSPEDVDKIVKELGDTLWYIAAVASELGVQLDTVALRNIDKLADRNARGVIKGSGDDR